MPENLKGGQPDEPMPLETVANVPAPSAAPGAPGDNLSFDGGHLYPAAYPGRTEAGDIQRELWNGVPDGWDYSTKWYGMGADASPDETEKPAQPEQAGPGLPMMGFAGPTSELDSRLDAISYLIGRDTSS